MGQRPPQKLYKYVGEKTALLILGSGQLQFSVPRLFNDEFDCNVGFSNSYNSQSFQKKLFELIFSITFDQVDTSQVNEEIVRIAESLHKIASIQHVPSSELIDDFLSGEGSEEIQYTLLSNVERFCNESSNFAVENTKDDKFCCFSEVSTSPPMWAHYGDNITGVALEFDTTHPPNNFFNISMKINYAPTPPKFFDEDKLFEVYTRRNGLFSEDELFEIKKKLILAKHVSWEYEKEWRILGGNTNEAEQRSLVPFHHLALTGVIFGTRTNAAFEQSVRNLIPYYPNCRTYKLKRPDMKTFEYQVVEYP